MQQNIRANFDMLRPDEPELEDLLVDDPEQGGVGDGTERVSA